MKKTILLAILLSAVSAIASADPGKHGHGHHGREFKEEYWDGDCKVERKVNKHGDVKEKRKCKGERRDERYDDGYRQTVVEERVYYPAPAPAPAPRQPGVSVDIHIGR